MRVITGDVLGWQTMLRHDVPSSSKVKRPRNIEGFPKPDGGMWTSTYLGREKVSDWVQWGLPEGMVRSDERLWLLPVRADLLIVQIDSREGFMAVLAQYGVDAPSWSRGGRSIDFEALKRDGYAGVNVTSEGQWATRYGDENLHGWDCESTVWLVGLTDAFIGCEEVEGWWETLGQVEAA